MDYKAAAFYKFVNIIGEDSRKSQSPADYLNECKRLMTDKAEQLNIGGLIILAEEGINGTVAGLIAQIDEFLNFIRGFAWASDIEAKYSPSNFQPFRRFKVDIRPEIVTSANLSLVVEGKNNHLSPKEWHEWLSRNDKFNIIDTRNDYESRVGTFRGALTPSIQKFNQFADFLANSGLPKEEPLLMFCTGGIRCEKAILEAKRLGYENAYQLEGGILKYLEEFPEGHFKGECFVFDNRVAVDSQLLPSQRYKLCPHCGEPGELRFCCAHCAKQAVACNNCIDKQACSKNCLYHLNLRPSNSNSETYNK